MKQRTEQIFLIALILLFGLQSRLAIANTHSCSENAQKYWYDFRKNTILGNLDDIAKVTRFPFLISGHLDDVAKISVSRDEFQIAFEESLKSDPGFSPVPETMISLVTKTSILPASFCNPNGNQFRVGSWIFTLTPQGWLFTEFFTNSS